MVGNTVDNRVKKNVKGNDWDDEEVEYPMLLEALRKYFNKDEVIKHTMSEKDETKQKPLDDEFPSNLEEALRMYNIQKDESATIKANIESLKEQLMTMTTKQKF